MKRLYKLFDLIVASCVDIPEAVIIKKELKPDVVVNFSQIDIEEFLLEKCDLEKSFMVSITRKHMVFSCSAGVYEILDGTTIRIMPKESATEEQIRIFLLGSAMGAIQIQRGCIPLHGGAIVSNNRAVIISGKSGAGKSTMTSALTSLGYEYLTDDVSSAVFAGEKPLILPAYPQRKLIRDACVLLGFNPKQLPIVDKNRDKFAIRDRVSWCNEAKELVLLTVLEPNYENDEVISAEITGIKKLGVVIQSLYRRNLHYVEQKLPPDDLKKLLQITSQIKVVSISIPRTPEKILDNARKIAIIIDAFTNI